MADKDKDKNKDKLPKVNMKPRSLTLVKAVTQPDPEEQKKQVLATPEPAKPKGRPKGAKNKSKSPVLVVEEEAAPAPEKQPLTVEQKEQIIDRMVDKNVAAGKVLPGRMASDMRWELKGRLRGWSPRRIAQEQAKAAQIEEERVPENIVIDLTKEPDVAQELQSAPVLVKDEAEEDAKKRVRKGIREADADWTPARPPHPILWKTNNAEYNRRLQAHQKFLLELGAQKAAEEAAPVAAAAADETWGFYIGWMGATVSLMAIRAALGASSL